MKHLISPSLLSTNPSLPVHVVGAGLAGSECAWQLAELGHHVVLHEMRGSSHTGVDSNSSSTRVATTPAHRGTDFAELVCSNSFGSYQPHHASAQLKWEAAQLGSLILQSAWETRVPAGQALSMDRVLFAQSVTAAIEKHPLIEIRREVIERLSDIPRPCVIATGPLTDGSLARDLQAHFGQDFLFFFDAIAPIISADSIDRSRVWAADRWGHGEGTGDYLNCPLSKKEYFFFIEALAQAPVVEFKDFEKDVPYFEGCMPIEALLARGQQTLRFGPMKPKGLPDPRTGQEPYAVVQLRAENREATAYNMVGFQTKMTYPAQKEVFRLIPGLEEAEFLKLGSLHRNLYVHTPKALRPDLSSPRDPDLFLAGQITGVEGYFESAMIGALVAHFIDQRRRQTDFTPPPRASALGSLHHAITDISRTNFQPTNINFGLFPEVPNQRDKLKKRELQLQTAREALLPWLESSLKKCSKRGPSQN